MEKETVFIIGASDGIGRETAEKFLSAGYRVVNASRTVNATEGITNLYCDCSSSETIKEAVKKASEDGIITTAIYCAGYSFFAPLEHSEESDYRYLFEVNFFGAVTFMREIIPIMRKYGGGRIFLVSSIGGVSPIAYESFYSASKAAMNMLSLSMNLELNRFGIYVISIMPGGTRTNFSFRRKVYEDTNYPYFEKAVKTLYKIEQDGDEPGIVADEIFEIAQKKRCIPIIASTGLKNKITHILTSLSPYKFTVFLCKKIFYGLRGE